MVLINVDEAMEIIGTGTFKKLHRGLAVVHVFEDGKAIGWYCSNIDLSVKDDLFKKVMEELYLHALIDVAEYRFDRWETLTKDPGTSYLCGPHADEKAMKIFGAKKENCLRVESMPVSVKFDVKTKEWLII